MPADATPNMKAFFDRAKKLQQQMVAAQDELAQAVVTGEAGNGLVTITVTGLGELKSIKIDPTLFDRGSVETLQDLVVDAIHSGGKAVQQLAEKKMGPVSLMSIF
jgi:nucleoid-associated protein EbfC